VEEAKKKTAKAPKKKTVKENSEPLNAVQTATTVQGAIAIEEPIVHFFDASEGLHNSVGYITVRQMLNDRFLGKLTREHYYAAAEGSEQIEELNQIAFKATKEAADENIEYLFAVEASCRMLMRKERTEKVIKALTTEGKNVMVIVDGSNLSMLDKAGTDAAQQLKASGIKLMLDNIENTSLNFIARVQPDFIAVDLRWYKEWKVNQENQIRYLAEFSKAQGITLCAVRVESRDDAEEALKRGIAFVSGHPICVPKRTVAAAIAAIKKI